MARAAAIAAKAEIGDAIRFCAPQFFFTATLPPMMTASDRAAIRRLKTSGEERLRHKYMATATKHALLAAGLLVVETHLHIVPLMIGDAARCKAAGDPADAPAFDLNPADQLSDGRHWRRTASHHAHAAPYGGSSFGPRGSACRCLVRTRFAFHPSESHPAAPSRAELGNRLRLTGFAQRGGIVNTRTQDLGEASN